MECKFRSIIGHIPEPTEFYTSRLCCSKDCLLLAVGINANIYFMDSSLELIRTINTDQARIGSLCMSYDDTRILSGHSNGYILYAIGILKLVICYCLTIFRMA